MTLVIYLTLFVMTFQKKYCFIKIRKECSDFKFFSFIQDNNGLILSIGLGVTGLVVLVLVTATIGLFRSREKEEQHKRRHATKKRFYDLSNTLNNQQFCNWSWKYFTRQIVIWKYFRFTHFSIKSFMLIYVQYVLFLSLFITCVPLVVQLYLWYERILIKLNPNLYTQNYTKKLEK